MHRLGLAVVTLAIAAAPAAADPTELGAWFGPRVFSADSLLGYIDNAPAHPVLDNSIELGVRVARPFFPWLVPEIELGIAPTGTNPIAATAQHGAAPSVSVFWMNPRLHMRFELAPGRRIAPFMVIGGGAPIAISSARKTFASDILGDGYLGGGVRFDSLKGFVLRFDARVSIVPGVERAVAPEFDIGFGIEFKVGVKRTRAEEVQIASGPIADRDQDGIPDATDQCPDRPEDHDGFEDLDGCPDIDNDLDRVLDIADRCPNVPETYNGYDDDDGCPDTLPPDVDSLRGTVEGLLYADGETVVRDSAIPNLKKIAKIMQAHPSIRVVLIGHTDDQEAKQFATTVEGQPPPDLAALSADLSRARAEAVRQALIAAGVGAPRVEIEGHGSEEPVADNTKAKGRLANRRVEIKLFVPPR